MTEVDACKQVAGTEFPNVCGPECDPDRCDYTLDDPDPSTLLWSEEFDVDGSPDPTNWDYDLGDGCNVGICNWGNEEQAFYTNSLNNVYVSNGSLKIVARKESGYSLPYTSARMVTRGKHYFKYGRIQFKANLSKCKAIGTWPALWMLPEFWVYGGWPFSGEIDVMETVGHEADRFFGTVHTEVSCAASFSGSNCYTLPRIIFILFLVYFSRISMVGLETKKAAPSLDQRMDGTSLKYPGNPTVFDLPLIPTFTSNTTTVVAVLLSGLLTRSFT